MCLKYIVVVDEEDETYTFIHSSLEEVDECVKDNMETTKEKHSTCSVYLAEIISVTSFKNGEQV